MDFTLSGGPSWGTQGIFDTAMYAGADMSFGVPDGIESVRMDAVRHAERHISAGVHRGIENSLSTP